MVPVTGSASGSWFWFLVLFLVLVLVLVLVTGSAYWFCGFGAGLDWTYPVGLPAGLCLLFFIIIIDSYFIYSKSNLVVDTSYIFTCSALSPLKDLVTLLLL